MSHEKHQEVFVPNFEYYAPKPTYTRADWAKYILLRVLVFPVLIWDVAKFIVNIVLGRLIGLAVYPLQLDSVFPDHTMWQWVDTDGVRFTSGYVYTHDGQRLATAEFAPETFEQDTHAKDQKYLVMFNGNGADFAAYYPQMAELAAQKNMGVVSSNPRGGPGSRFFYDRQQCATSKDQLVVDAIAQVQRLLDKGILPEHIMLKGHSLGGAIATLTAAHFHKLSKPVRLFNSRSFSTVTNVVVGFIRTGFQPKKNSERVILKLFGWALKPIVSLILHLANWELDAASAYRSIPERYRNLVCVHHPKKLRQDDSIDQEDYVDDEIISSYASLYAAMKDESKEQKAKIQAAIEHLKDVQESAPLTPELNDAASRAQAEAKKLVEGLSHKKLILHNAPFSIAHMSPLSTLRSRPNLGEAKSGDVILGEFIDATLRVGY